VTGRLSFGGILRSEWIKLWSLRSTWWCYGVTLVLTVGIGALLASAMSVSAPASVDDIAQAGFQTQAVQAATVGLGFSTLATAVLGVLAIAGEYSTGQIRSTFAAVPNRVVALLGKLLVFMVATFAVAVVTLALCAAATLPLLTAAGLPVDLADPDYWLCLLAGAGYVALLGGVALLVGAIVKVPAGGIMIVVALILVLPQALTIAGVLAQQTWLLDVNTFLPSNLGSAMSAYPTGADMAGMGSDAISLDPWQAAAALAAWVVVLGVAASLIVRRRDV